MARLCHSSSSMQTINAIWLLLTLLSALATGSSSQSEPNYGPAVGCVPPTLQDPQPLGVPIPELAADKKPNFIIIMTDDQGWDDVAMHHPQQPDGSPPLPKTPNIDKFLKQSTKFDNFYVTPMCAQTRAAFLTGRSYPRTSTMLVSGGWDFLNKAETTSAQFMAANGYQTAHFGKWHNGRSLGYEPWFQGFEESWHPEQYIHLDNLMRHNGEYIQTYGLMEQVLMDKILTYLDYQASSSQPFFLYYAPNAIHRGSMRPGEGPKWTRPSPEAYKAHYRPYVAQYNVSYSTIEVWAMMEYMDDVLGRLFEYLEKSPLKENTYIMLFGDNGSELFVSEWKTKEKRMPSGMQGYKRDIEEGGIRNFLGVQGPGVQAGVIDSTLVDVVDILPTMADLAGIAVNASEHNPWDGISIKNLLLSGGEVPATARRGISKATVEQEERFLFALGPLCWDSNAVPDLGKDRDVVRTQELLSYDYGGYMNKELLKYYNMSLDLQGWYKCIAVRHKDYKWNGRTGKVYKFHGDSHIELPCNEVTGEEADGLIKTMSAAAWNYWQSVVKDDTSFKKPTFYLGLNGWSVTNILPDGAHERTKGRLQLLPNGVYGFAQPGDRMCFGMEIMTAGQYEVVLIYTSKQVATFKFSIGTLAAIEGNTSPALTAELPLLKIIGGQYMGTMDLPSSTPGEKMEACLELLASSEPGKPVFANLGVIRMTLLETAGGTVAVAGKKSIMQVPGPLPPPTKPSSKPPKMPVLKLKPGSKPGSAPVPVAVRAPGLDMSSGEMRWLIGPQNEKSATDEAPQAAAPAKAAKPPGSSSSKLKGQQATGVQQAATSKKAGKPAAINKPKAAAAVSSSKAPVHPRLNATPRMKATEQEAILHAANQRAKERRSSGNASEGGAAAEWQELRLKHNWPDGQGKLESMYSPYHAEGIDMCSECQPEL